PQRITHQAVGYPLLASALHHHPTLRWACRLILLMPDHLHALLQFPAPSDMSCVIGDWKRFTARKPGISWQTNYFDHRIRDRHGLQEKYIYIRRNPVAKGLCACEA